MKRAYKNPWLIAASVIAFVLVISGGAYALGRHTTKSDTATISYGKASEESASIPSASQTRIDAAVAADNKANAEQTVDDRLLYLIEEEKLAHDVYQKLYELYGARTFSNIMRSETQHQNLVLAVLASRNLADPRSEQIGVFTNQDLQKLYDTLVAQGSQNLTEAYKVGVTIEEVDIADLTADLKLVDATETDVTSMMNTLKSGSLNHLNAFSKHV